MTTITLNRLGKSFGAQRAVSDVDIAIPEGAFLVLLGPSGCGKTTTLRMLAGLEDPTEGSIHFDDRLIADRSTSMPSASRGLGMVFQSYALWPHMRVRDNIDWPLRIAGWNATDRTARVAEVIGMLDLDGLADRFPSELSGGQQQRVAIARTIAPRPGVLLFDEPLSNLDARLRVETRAELVKVHRASGATSVYVTHDQVEALAMATHIAVMRGGRVEQFGTPTELLERPATAFVASFLGTPAHVLLEGDVQGGDLVCGDLVLARGVDITARHAAFAPDEVALVAAADGAFEVLEATPMAGRWVVTGNFNGQRVSVVTAGAWQPGTRAGIVLPQHPRAVFDVDGRRSLGHNA